MNSRRGFGAWKFGLAWAIAIAGMGLGAAEASADYRSEVLADNPFAYYRLDDSVGNPSGLSIMDDEVGGVGSHINVPSSSMGHAGALPCESVNRAITYSSATDDASTAGLPGGLSDFSIEYWVKTTQSGGGTQWWQGSGLVDAEVAGVLNDFGTALVSGNKVGFGLGNPDTTLPSAGAINDGAWHHIVATRSGATMKLYVDGALSAERNDGPTAARNGTNGFFSIAQRNDVGNQASGAFDEVALYSSALPAADVAAHYDAAQCAPPPRTITTLVNIGANTALGHGQIHSSDGVISCPALNCGANYPEGTVTEFLAEPDPGSRFGGWQSLFGINTGIFDCQPTSFSRCVLVADNASNVESVSGAFYKTSQTIGSDLFSSFGQDTKILEEALDNAVNPKNKKAIDFKPIPLQRCASEIGDCAGVIAVNVKASEQKLIGSDGATIISRDGAGFTPTATSVEGTASLMSDQGTGLISNRSAGVIVDNAGNILGNHGGALIGSDGATLVGNAGNTIIGNAGGNRIAPRAARKPKPKPKELIYALGSYGIDTTSSGDVGVTFTPTKVGKKIMKTFAQQNLALKRPMKLQAMYVEAIRPADGRGTGGTYMKLGIK